MCGGRGGLRRGGGNGRKGGAGAPRLPAWGIGTQCQRSAGVPSNDARRRNRGGQALFILRLPFFGFPALVISCLWPDISPGQMQGDYNEDLCVF